MSRDYRGTYVDNLLQTSLSEKNSQTLFCSLYVKLAKLASNVRAIGQILFEL